MSDPMKQGHRQSAEYEREDLGARSVFTFLIGLLVMGVLVFGFLKVMLHVLEAYNRSHQPPQHPLAMKTVPVPEQAGREKSKEGIKAAFPDPRLEDDEIHQLREFRAALWCGNQLPHSTVAPTRRRVSSTRESFSATAVPAPSLRVCCAESG